jgi:hypothetical protein
MDRTNERSFKKIDEKHRKRSLEKIIKEGRQHLESHTPK